MTIKEGGVITAGVDADLDIPADRRGREGLDGALPGQGHRALRHHDKIEFGNLRLLPGGPAGQVAQVPPDFVRKQTLKNAERYITPELKEFEDKVLRAEERAEAPSTTSSRPSRRRSPVRFPHSRHRPRPRRGRRARRSRTDRRHPALLRTERGRRLRIEIESGRHPVVEATQTDVTFVPNGTSSTARSAASTSSPARTWRASRRPSGRPP